MQVLRIVYVTPPPGPLISVKVLGVSLLQSVDIYQRVDGNPNGIIPMEPPTPRLQVVHVPN